jgi:hypothetical protein
MSDRSRRDTYSQTLAFLDDDILALEGTLKEMEVARSAVWDELRGKRQARDTLKRAIEREERAAAAASPKLPYDDLPDPSASASDTPEPSGLMPDRKEALKSVLQEAAGQVLTVAEIADRMLEHGWIQPDVKHPTETIRFSLKWLSDRDAHVKRVTPGSYRYVSDIEREDRG